MNIQEAARRSGLPAKTIRYYEEIGLVAPLRSPNGYRRFRDRDLGTLGFLARARALGFSIEDCRHLLSLWQDRSRASAEVKAVAERHLAEIETKIATLQSLRGTLRHLVSSCHGDDRPDCPILEDLAPTGG